MAKVIAEMSGNHNGSLDTALKIVEEVAKSGAEYLKLQTYTPDTITIPVSGGLFQVSENHPLWGSKNLYDLYQEAFTPWEWHAPIFEKAKSLGLIPFSTPFDETAVAFLEDLDVALYKIASLEIIDLPLIEMVAKTGKPMIISTGTASISEIAEAVESSRKGGCDDLTLMICTSSYPAKPEDSNLARMNVLREIFDVKVGFSDHTLGINVAIAASALGAEFIEKHVTLARDLGGVDSQFSLEPKELRNLVQGVREAESSRGISSVWGLESESESIRHRPSLYVTANVSEGDIVSVSNVRSVRPSGGLEPKFIGAVLGKKFVKSAILGTPFTLELISE